MVGPIRIDGLASGIDYTSIIEKLLAVERRPITNLQTRIAIAEQKKASFLQVNANLLALKGAANVLSRPSFFNGTIVTSSNESVLKATGSQGTTSGSFTFSVRQLATTHQIISNGFADEDTTSVTDEDAVITLEMGGGHLDRDVRLDRLNGGSGVDRGIVKITDSDGRVGLVDLEGAVTVSDVVDAINNNTNISVTASLAADRIVVTNLAAGAGPFSIANYGSDSTATDLGIAGTGSGPGNDYIYGNRINFVTGDTLHNELNDGLGIRRNSDGQMDFRIVGPNGASVDIDIRSTDKTVQAILDRINTAAGANFTASLTPDGTSIQVSGAGSGGFSVAALNGSMAAFDLGLASYEGGAAVAAPVEDAADGSIAGGADLSQRLVGHRLIPTLNSTLTRLLNGGTTHNDAAANVTGAFGVGDTAISVDDATGLFVGDRIRISEAGVLQVRRIEAINGNTITLDQGLSSAVTAAADVYDLQGAGDKNSTNQISVTDRSGASFSVTLDPRVFSSGTVTSTTTISASSVDGFSVGSKIRIVESGVVYDRTVTGISGSVLTFDQALPAPVVGAAAGVQTDNGSLGQILNTLNDRAAPAGVDVRFEYDGEGNGIKVVDFSGGSGALSVSDLSGSLASDLGFAGSASANSMDGTDLDVQYVSSYTALADLNGGRGVEKGRIRITDTNGTQFEVDLSQSNDTTIGAVIFDINGAASVMGSSVVARLNNTGDGIILIDTAPGPGTLRVDEKGNTRTARDLNLEGSANSGTPDQINGSFERRIAISAGSKLKDVREALNSSGLQVTASIVNDGSPTNPYRLTILSKTSGQEGRLSIDSNIPALSFNTTTKAKDSILLFGTAGNDPLMLTSSNNRYTNIVPGLTLDLQGVSESPVNVTASRDTQSIVAQATTFVEKYNAAVQVMRELTYFDTDSFERGPLFGDSTIRRVQQDLGNLVTLPVGEIPSGNIRTLQELGFKLTTEGGLTLDTSKFQEALETNFEEVQDLFTRQRRLLLDTPVADLNSGLGVSTVAGDDIRIRARDSLTNFTVDLSSASTVGSILSAINNAAGNNGAITASISSDGFSIVLSDNSSVPDRAVDAGPPAPTADTFVETDLIGVDKDTIIGATITFLAGAGVNAGQVRKITDFNSATGEITLESSLAAAPGAGDPYRMERELQVQSINDSTAGNQLKLTSKASLGLTILKSSLLNLANDPGIGFRIDNKLDVITRSGDGFISIKTDSLDDNVEGLNDTIERIEERVKMVEERLVREFANLEVVLAKSQSTMSRLQSSMAAIQSLMASSNGAR